MDYKIIVSAVAVVLSFVGYGVYTRDILRKKTVPHVFTFLIWSITSFITWALQASGGAGVGGWITFAVSVICVIIFFLSLKYGEKKITKLDVLFLIISFVTLVLWLYAKQPVLSMVLLVVSEVVAFAPTVRKSWDTPFQENLFTWELTAFRHGLSIFALEKFNVLTLLYPLTWVMVNAIFSVILIVRRKQIVQEGKEKNT